MLKNLHASVGDIRDMDLIPCLGRSPGGEQASPLHIFAWRMLWTEEPGGLQSIGSQKSDTPEATSMYTRMQGNTIC